MKIKSSAPENSPTHSTAPRPASWRRLIRPLRKLFSLLGLAALLATGAAHAQPVVLDCSCLSTQAILFTNACCGVIPDLCPVAATCYLPSLAPAPTFTCTQFPLPGTPVCGTTPITFTLTENTTAAFSTTCTVNYVTGFTTNRFMILCPPIQVLPCNTTNLVFPAPAVTNLVLCCTNPVILTGPVLVTNWPTITASWVAMQCGVVDFCQQTFVFANSNGLSCQCLDLFCPSNIVVQTCLGLPGTTSFGLTNIFYPLPVVSNSCLGAITNLTCTPPSGSPFPVGTNTVTCTVYDNLGNVATCTFDIIVLGDTTPPVVTCGPNQVVQCGSLWAPIPPTAVDNCCSNVIIQIFGAVTNTSGPCLETIDFFWHVMDCNGNFANCTNTVTVIDTTPPTIVCNSNQTYQCSTTATGWTPVPPTATDNCCTSPVVSLISAVTNVSSLCNEIITLNWKAVDCCTNTAFCTEVINIVDTTPPTINCQPFKQIQCGSGPNWFGDYPTAFDACCGTNVTISLVNVITNVQTTCLSRYTLTWTATDCCTNTSGPCIQMLQVVDTTPPNVICATNKVVLCGTAWTFDPPVAVDDCCTNPPVVTIFNTVTNGLNTCPLVVTRNWQITDCCGNSTNCSQTVTVIDNVPPVIVCNSNQIVQCGSAWTLTTPTATDNCCATSAIVITLNSVVTNTFGPCLQTIVATWEADDCCGNKSFCTETVSVVDTVPPVINCVSNQTIQCLNASTPAGGGWQPIPPTAFDACCGTNVTVSLISSNGSGALPCNGTITLIWKATDCCTNNSFCTEIVTVLDTNPPSILCNGPRTEECGTGWTFDTPTAFDACCGTNVTLTVVSNVTVFSSPCLSIYTRYWMATDCCTNAAFCSQTITEIDTHPPVLTCASNFTVNCGSPWSFTPPTAIDACCGTNVTITVIGTITNAANLCPIVITRGWRATDCCSNSVTCSQTVTIVDTVPPVITCGPNQTLPCGTAWSLIPPTAFDACCGTNVSISLVQAVTNNIISSCVQNIAAVWQAMDCCGNKSFCTNFVTLTDNIPPVLTCRSNYIVQCGSPIAPPKATDNCCPNPTVTILSAITNGIGPCNQILTITWQAMDCCTNTSTCVEVITVTDTTPPVVTCAPNKTIQCNTAVTFDPPTAIDACCGTNLTITVLSTSPLFGTPCSSSTTRTWQITDCCTNSITCAQTITVVDTTPPVINCGPNQTVQCGTLWTWGPNPTATDNCCNNITVALFSNGVSTPSPCTTVYSQTWSATDCCGNVSFCTRTTTTVDTVPPTITCAANFTVNVGTPWTFTTPTAFDACCGPTLIIMATTTNITGCQVVHTRFWKAVDCCGNSSPICSQSVTVNMTPPPNDPCSNPFPLVLNGAYICGSNICATPSLPGTLNPAPCGGSLASPDVWYTVTAVCTAPMTVDLCPPCAPHPTFDTVLSAYTGPCNFLTQAGPTACNDDACGLRSIITFPAVAGQTYRIRVAGYFGAVGWFSIRATQTVSPPPNDLCVNAIVISNLNSSVCGSTLCGATPTPLGTLIPTPCGASVSSPDVWYKITPQCNGAIILNTCGNCPPAGTFDTVLSVYTGNCSLLNQVAGGCNDDAGPLGPCPWTLQSYVSFIPVPGVTYYIRVSGFTPFSTGDFRLNINQAATTPPPNDLCANATVVNAGSYAWNNCSANTDGPGSPCGLQNDVWFRYTPVCSGTIMINTCLSGINTAIAVYTGNCNALSLVGCNASAGAGSCAGSGQSYMTFAGVAGTTYRIRVGSSSAVTGSGILNIVGPSPLAVPTCGTGSVFWHYYLIQGTGNNIPWAWSASSPCCSNMRDLNVPGVTGSAFVLASAFAGSINAQCASTAVAFPINFNNAILGIATRCGPGAPLILQVGPASTPPLSLCVVSGFLLPTTGPCSFNPDIYEMELTGHDANNNGIDDYIDIVTGTSADVNGDMIPDEAQNCFGPQVTAKPDSQLVEIGQSVTLHVAVSGTAPFSYQWLLNGVPIPGANSDTLTINPVAAANLGDYGVTVSNACGTLDGTAANIYVTPTSLPVLYDASLADGWFRFMVETKIGYDYVVEFKNDLTDPAWTTLNTVPGSGAPQLIYDSEPPPQMRYYRVRQQSPMP